MNLSDKHFADVRVVAVSGRVDHPMAEAFREALWPFLESCGEGNEKVVLDLSGMDYISSAGLRILMLAAREVKPRNGTVVVASLQPVVLEIFEISRFNLVFRVFADVDTALAELSPEAAKAAAGN